MPIRTESQIHHDFIEGQKAGVALTWSHLEERDKKLKAEMSRLEAMDAEMRRSHLTGREAKVKDRWGENKTHEEIVKELEDLKAQYELVEEAEDETLKYAHEHHLDREEEEYLVEECDNVESALAFAKSVAREFENQGLTCTIDRDGDLFKVTVAIPLNVEKNDVVGFITDHLHENHFSLDDSDTPSPSVRPTSAVDVTAQIITREVEISH